MTSPDSRRFVIDMYSSRFPLWCMPEGDLERIRALLPGGWELTRIRVETDGSGDGVPRTVPELREVVRDAEVYCGFGIARDLFREARSLRWVHSGAAGVGSSLFPEMVESDVVFTNSAGTHAVPVAEHALAMMFYLARGLDRLEPARRRAVWDRDPVARDGDAVRELTGATVAVIGYGGIGSELGRRASGLGMRVWAVKRSPGDGASEDVERTFGPGRLDEALAGADFVVLTVPHTPETDGLIGARELELMKEDAVLINVARGHIIEEHALIDALEAGRIRGAGLDVFAEEPLPSSSPLWELENVCLTPHVAGVSPRFWERETDLIIENTGRYLAGEPLLNQVDKQAGY